MGNKTREQRMRPCPHCGKAPGKSGFFGVAERRVGGYLYYMAHIKGEYLGNFDNPVDAALAFDAASKRLFGIHAVLNFPEEK